MKFDEEQRNAFLTIAAFNVTCLIVSWIMRNRLDVNAQEKSDKRARQAEWDALSEYEKMKHLKSLLPKGSFVTPEQAAARLAKEEEEEKKK